MQSDKLSGLQKRILLDVLQSIDARNAEGERRGKWCASDRVTFSRTVRRLEARGLVIGEHKRGRAVCLNLTDDGREIAQYLHDAPARLAQLQAGNAQYWERYRKNLEQWHAEQSAKLAKQLARGYVPRRVLKTLQAAFPLSNINWLNVLRGTRCKRRRPPAHFWA